MHRRPHYCRQSQRRSAGVHVLEALQRSLSARASPHAREEHSEEGTRACIRKVRRHFTRARLVRSLIEHLQRPRRPRRQPRSSPGSYASSRSRNYRCAGSEHGARREGLSAHAPGELNQGGAGSRAAHSQSPGGVEGEEGRGTRGAAGPRLQVFAMDVWPSNFKLVHCYVHVYDDHV